MSFQGALWVKITNIETDLATLQRQDVFKAHFLEDEDFACLANGYDGEDVPTDDLEELSQQFNEAIFMSYHLLNQRFVYSHWFEGEALRELNYNQENGWTKVTGGMEAWESEFLFNENALTALLESFDEDMEEEALEARAIWEQQSLQEDSLYPTIDVSELYQQLVDCLKLTRV